MKIISVPEPMSGTRLTASSMLPASLRAGIITEQRRCGDRGSGLTRATIVTVRHKGPNTGANHRFRSPANRGVPAGQRIRGWTLIISQPARWSKFATSLLESQFCSSVGAFRPRRSVALRIGRQRLLKKFNTNRVRDVADETNL